MSSPSGRRWPVAEAPPPHRVIKDMGITHAEFHRILPSLFTDAVPVVQGSTVSASWPAGRRLVITLGPEQQRRIALLALPRTLVTLDFQGFTPDQRSAFLRHFDRRFQRGGG